MILKVGASVAGDRDVFIPCDGPVGKFFQARLMAATSRALADHDVMLLSVCC